MAPPHSCPCRTACTPRCFAKKEFTCQHPGPLLSWRAPGLHKFFFLTSTQNPRGLLLVWREWIFLLSSGPSPNGFQSTQQHPPHPHLPPPHLLGRKMTPLVLNSNGPFALALTSSASGPTAAPAGSSPHPSNSLTPLLFFSLSNSLFSPPDQLDLSLASIPITLGL